MEDDFYFQGEFRHYSSSSHSHFSPTTVEIAGISEEMYCPQQTDIDWTTSRPVFPAAGQSLASEHTEEVPPQPVFPPLQLEDYLKELLHTYLRFNDMFVQKRRNHQKYKDDPPSFLAGHPLPSSFKKTPLSAAKLGVDQMKDSFRRTVFALPDFLDVSTASRRHACMGILADSYRIYMKMNADLDRVTQEVCGEACDSELSAMLSFLACIEEHPELPEVCKYCVVSKSSSTAKGVLRKIYLDLLALRHNTTPILAQELVPGFTYDHIESLDEVVQLVEQDSTRTDDQEVERFRQSLLRAKAPEGPKVQVVVSEQFLAMVEARLKNSKTTRA
jgi:hypothetical protein